TTFGAISAALDITREGAVQEVVVIAGHHQHPQLCGSLQAELPSTTDTLWLRLGHEPRGFS
ncbi:hypothetical protein, partial [Neoaquamicrobium sediminum]|uniref:hypothetical protein n=1 Tax=Neoaquamicrobium sediminum TaxID=1849104 RepID=UPI0040365D58